jgi:hypothetical protein
MSLIGGRRQGKSVMLSKLLRHLQDEFDVLISFTGTVSCSPHLRQLYDEVSHWNPEFMFNSCNAEMLKTICQQQEDLKARGVTRRIALLFDDVEFDNPEGVAYLGFTASRGRHYNISMFQVSVSYTLINKNFRRSLDVLGIFSLPSLNDKQILLKEYSRNPDLGSFAMDNLEKFECLIMETNSHKQELFKYKVPFESSLPDPCTPPENTNPQTDEKTLPDPTSATQNNTIDHFSDAILKNNDDAIAV